jgi:hypothetical protein
MRLLRATASVLDGKATVRALSSLCIIVRRRDETRRVRRRVKRGRIVALGRHLTNRQYACCVGSDTIHAVARECGGRRVCSSKRAPAHGGVRAGCATRAGLRVMAVEGGSWGFVCCGTACILRFGADWDGRGWAVGREGFEIVGYARLDMEG